MNEPPAMWPYEPRKATRKESLTPRQILVVIGVLAAFVAFVWYMFSTFNFE